MELTAGSRSRSAIPPVYPCRAAPEEDAAGANVRLWRCSWFEVSVELLVPARTDALFVLPYLLGELPCWVDRSSS